MSYQFYPTKHTLSVSEQYRFVVVFLSVLNCSLSDHVTIIFGTHMTRNTSIRNGGRCLVYNRAKYEQSRLRLKEIMAAKIRVSPPTLKVK